VTLASPSTTDVLCRPLDTGGTLSCFNNRGRSVINANRWKYGASTYGNDLTNYRIYVISHEVGHALGHNHEYSCREDGLAPVMMQQTKSLYGCKKNPWPHPDED
jgi:ssRNA-specific RNase YbeY (16S rRNA maturation enzyme)